MSRKRKIQTKCRNMFPPQGQLDHQRAGIRFCHHLCCKSSWMSFATLSSAHYSLQVCSTRHFRKRCSISCCVIFAVDPFAQWFAKIHKHQATQRQNESTIYLHAKRRNQTKCRNMFPLQGQLTIRELGLGFVIICLFASESTL